jgi:hypothetical protein
MTQSTLKQLFYAAMMAQAKQSYCMGSTGTLCDELTRPNLEASLEVIKAIEDLPIPEIEENADGW